MPDTNAKFLSGSIMRHIVTMTLTGAIGLTAVFAVDLADLYFLSLLNDTSVTAAIGFAGAISFANLSLSIGMGVAAAALVARNLGARDPDRAKDFASSAFYFTLIISALYTFLIALFVEPLLWAMGARGDVLANAATFIRLLSPGFICLAGALSCSFSLRGIGDPRRAMYLTLSSAIATIILDPLFIFGLGMGIKGAAIANAIADLIALLAGLSGLHLTHRFLRRFSLSSLKRDFAAVRAIAFPSMLTQLATPFAAAYTTFAVAPFGDEAVAASAIIGRIVPVAFGMIFSLSGSVGPIIGQNYGAKNFERVRVTLYEGMRFSAIYTLITSALLFLFRHPIADAFNASGSSKSLILFFCTYVAVSWAFGGAQFVANAAFNNLGRPGLSTWTNWGKATLGTIPFAMAGGMLAGAEGIISGIAIGSVIFGIASVFLAYKIVGEIEPRARQAS